MKPIQYTLLFIILISSLLLASCSDDDCSDPIEEFTWSQNQTIQLDTTVTQGVPELIVTSGQENVFEYFSLSEVCVDFIGLTGGVQFFMAIPADSTDSFQYTDQEIAATSAHTVSDGQGCFQQIVRRGEIRGTRIDGNSWQVSIDIITTENVECPIGFPLVVDGVFTLE